MLLGFLSIEKSSFHNRKSLRKQIGSYQKIKEKANAKRFYPKNTEVEEIVLGDEESILEMKKSSWR